MSNKQLTALFACALIPWTIGNGMLPLLPVYATRIGASQTVVGLFMAVSYAALAVGTLAAGWLSDRYQRRKQMIILSGLVCIPFLLLLGTAQNIWILALYSSAVFFLGGAAIALIGILAGLFAGGRGTRPGFRDFAVGCSSGGGYRRRLDWFNCR